MPALSGGRHFGISLILLFCAMGLTFQAHHLGLTIDEPSHFAAAYMWWLGEDVLLPSDTPPLTRIISGWIPMLFRTLSPRETKGWAERDAYLIGGEILGRPNTQGLLFCSRLPFIVFPLLIVFLLWYWGRQLFGESIALLLAACGALEPTILGHGALIKSDVAAAFGALWFAYTAWRYWQTPTAARLALMTVALIVAILTKFTLLPLVIIGYGLGLWRGPRLLATFLIPIALYVGILAASQFQAHPVAQAEINQFPGAGVPSWALPAAHGLARLPWPVQYVRGLLYIGGSLHGEGFAGYMLGHRIHGRVPGYFPLAWAIKFPIPLQFLAMAGLAALLLRIRRWEVGVAEVLIWGLAAFFFVTAVFSTFHIGFRHVLPTLPFLILGGGFALDRWGRSRWGRWAIAVSFAWLAISSLYVYPQGISYFNEWIGGPANGWKYLADSNVDWGQNLPELGDYIKRHRIETVNTFLFSSDYPWRCLAPGTIAPQPWPSDEPNVARQYEPKPGTYAISVNVLTGFLFPPGREDYLNYFLQRRIEARAGYSILIYKVK